MAEQETTALTTEEKIKEAATKIFIEKGFSATRTRDIAMEAGINLALLNYYFRSKEKLFEVVMTESLQLFLVGLEEILNDVNTVLKDKIAGIAIHYVDLLKKYPDLPLFILSEVKANPSWLEANSNVREMLTQSNFYKQLEATTQKKVEPLHFLMNLLGVLVFPFVASPVLTGTEAADKAEFNQLMEERKYWIPIWMEAMLKTLSA
ncbi:TetR/AcrR family transcriptional regulator [Pedobacter gandavensis]|uniref:TetR family transcriptional regulator n=1 Tax=Pedobacter gandavensis TaxID=2679963 RepID=A0ABR6F0Z5_9SPHI|nr:TetR family transcriptional regulator [Pedobacter gandavensis]MBB2150358.1 TetR family transcriptional regulator [Pedobacter gandavensis]